MRLHAFWTKRKYHFNKVYSEYIKPAKALASKFSELMKNNGQATSAPTCFKSCC